MPFRTQHRCAEAASRCQCEQLGRLRALRAVRHLLAYVESIVSLANTFDLGSWPNALGLRDFFIGRSAEIEILL